MKKYVEIAIMLITWFALILQLIILKDSIANYFSYFTILSNLLVAISLTSELLASTASFSKIFSLPKTKSAIALYILIVGLVYNLVLRGIWEPKGWQLVADNLLHVVVPLTYFSYWAVFVNKGSLVWKDMISWTYFPLAYLAYSLIRGYLVNWYPYPFLDVTQFGYQQVLINAFFVVLAFVGIGLAMIYYNKLMARNR